MKLRGFVLIVAVSILSLAVRGEAFAQDYRPTPEQQKTWRELMETSPSKGYLLDIVCSTALEEVFRVLAAGELLRSPLEKWEGINLLSCNPPEPYANLLWEWLGPKEMSVDELLQIFNFWREGADKADRELKSRDLSIRELAHTISRMEGNSWSEKYAGTYWEKLLRHNPNKEGLLEVSRGRGNYARVATSELIRHYPLTNSERREIVYERRASLEELQELAWQLLSVNPTQEDLAAVAYSPLEPYNRIAMELLLASDPATKREAIRRSMYK